MISGVQILGLLFAVGMLYLVFLHYKKGALTIFGAATWAIAWIGILLATVFPLQFTYILRPLSIVRLLDFVTIIGMMFLGVITYYNFIIVKKNEKKVETLVSNFAAEKAHKGKVDNLE